MKLSLRDRLVNINELVTLTMTSIWPCGDLDIDYIKFYGDLDIGYIKFYGDLDIGYIWFYGDFGIRYSCVIPNWLCWWKQVCTVKQSLVQSSDLWFQAEQQNFKKKLVSTE